MYRSLSVAPPSFALHRDTVTASSKQPPLASGAPFVHAGLPKVRFEFPESGAEPTPQPHPFYLEPNCFFIVRGEVKELVSLVDAVLRDKDAVFKPAKCKWKACSYVRNSCLDFRVVLFHGDWEPDQYVVEFQRRQGCAFQFAALVRSARAHFVRAGKVCNEAGEIEPAPSSEPASPRDTGFFPPSAGALPKPALTREVLTPIVELASSEYADMQHQAVREIANLAEDPAARAVLATFGGLVERLAQCARSADRGLHRCAAAALCHFARQSECREAVVANIDCLLSLCARGGDEADAFLELETRRQAAQCLLCVCQGANVDAVAEKCRPVFEGLRRSSDDRLRSCAENACRALATC